MRALHDRDGRVEYGGPVDERWRERLSFEARIPTWEVDGTVERLVESGLVETTGRTRVVGNDGEVDVVREVEALRLTRSGYELASETVSTARQSRSNALVAAIALVLAVLASARLFAEVYVFDVAPLGRTQLATVLLAVTLVVPLVLVPWRGLSRLLWKAVWIAKWRSFRP